MTAPLTVLTPGADAPAPPPKPGILDVPADDLRAWLADRREPPLRVKQIRRWVLAGRAESFDQMSDLPKPLRADLAEHFAVLGTRVEHHAIAADGTHKLVL